MKTKLFFQTPAAIFILVASLAASAQPAPRMDPSTGLPAGPGMPAINPAAGLATPRAPILPPSPGGAVRAYAPGAPPMFEPATGLLATPTEPQWIDPSWADPNIVLTNVSYDNLPLSEVARDLRERFKNNFDILPMPRTFDRDWGSDITIQLQLKAVKASDVFNAMNLVFENDRTPLRWELKMNHNRPLALLRVLPEAAPQPERPQPRPAETKRMVYFVGNLLGDEKSGGMTMNQIIKTISDVWPADFGRPDLVIQFHQEAQLLVANGTRDQLEFIQQILSALRQKVSAANPQSPVDRLINARKTNSDDAK